EGRVATRVISSYRNLDSHRSSAPRLMRAVGAKGPNERPSSCTPTSSHHREESPDRIRTFGLCLGEQNGIAAPRYSLTEALESEETTGVWFERERVYGCPRRTSVARTALRPGGRAAPGLASMRDLGKVTGQMFAGDIEGRTAIILDDMITTGGTMTRAAAACRAHGAAEVIAIATHGLFVD